MEDRNQTLIIKSFKRRIVCVSLKEVREVSEDDVVTKYLRVVVLVG